MRPRYDAHQLAWPFYAFANSCALPRHELGDLFRRHPQYYRWIRSAWLFAGFYLLDGTTAERVTLQHRILHWYDGTRSQGYGGFYDTT